MDESRIVSWSLRLWNTATGQQILSHDNIVDGAILNRRGSRILSWSKDRTLRLWDTATGQEVIPRMRHDDTVSGAILSKDESRILSWSEDKTVRLWDADRPTDHPCYAT